MQYSAHNNISAKKAHSQLADILKPIRLSDDFISAIKAESLKKLQESIEENRTLLQNKKHQLEQINRQLKSV